jgi:hypothetical protein
MEVNSSRPPVVPAVVPVAATGDFLSPVVSCSVLSFLLTNYMELSTTREATRCYAAR